MAHVSMTVNGKATSADVDPRTLLVQYLRDNLRLTGTHVGCDTSQCGACVVHVNGRAVKACTVFALSLQGAEVLTIEGLAPGTNELHPLQRAFIAENGFQCGFCTSGMILSAKSLLEARPRATEDEVLAYMEGNLCRCTGYRPIVAAIQRAQRELEGPAPDGEQAHS